MCSTSIKSSLLARAWSDVQSSVPAGRLKHLRTLEISKNSLTTLPKDIGRLVSLEYLDVRENKLTILPKELMDCENLQVGLLLCTAPTPRLHVDIPSASCQVLRRERRSPAGVRLLHSPLKLTDGLHVVADTAVSRSSSSATTT